MKKASDIAKGLLNTPEKSDSVAKGNKIQIDSIFHRKFTEIIGPDYYKIWDEHPEIKTTVWSILRYFMSVERFDACEITQNKPYNPSLSKGILLTGSVGVGKTALFEVIHSIGKELGTKSGKFYFVRVSAPFFVREYMASTQRGYHGNMEFSRYCKGPLYIDDLGAEDLCFGRYELIGDLLFERHLNNALTFCTSNLTRQQLGEKYGVRVADRLHEMFNFYQWPTEDSLRK